jgi:hypothetical protein
MLNSLTTDFSTTIQRVCHLRPQKAGDDSMIIDLCRLLINAGASDSEPLHRQIKEASGYCYPDFNWYYGSPALFQVLQQRMYPRYYDVSMEVRFEIIKGIIFWQYESARDIFRLALGNANFSREMLVATDCDGRYCIGLGWL